VCAEYKIIYVYVWAVMIKTYIVKAHVKDSRLIASFLSHIQKNNIGLGMVADYCNHSYLGGRDPG
jgi:hypothetical protein